MIGEMKLNNGLGEKISGYIKSRGIKQTYIAMKASLSNSHLSNVLKDRVVITPDVLKDINSALNTDFTLDGN